MAGREESDSNTMALFNLDSDPVGPAMTPEKPAGITRMYFVNINGMRYGAQGGEYSEMCATTLTNHIDIMGIAETHFDTTSHALRRVCHDATRRVFRHSKLVMSSSSRSYDSYNKRGGTLLLSQGNVVGRIHSTSSDRMGRWCTTTYAGKNRRMITVISAYQVCKSNPVRDTSVFHRTKNYSAVTQQYSMMVEEGLPLSRHPRAQFHRDLAELITDLRKKQHDILLMGDFNEELHEDPDSMARLQRIGGLVDLMNHKIGTNDFSTYIRGTKRLDYVLCSPRLLDCCHTAGYDSIGYRYDGDHRGFYMDFQTAQLFGNQTPVLATPAARSLHSRNTSQRATYVKAKHKYLSDHNWFQRLQDLLQTSAGDSFDPTTLESLDRDWVRASRHGEKQCTKFPSFPFSVPLANKRSRKRALRLMITSIKCRVPLKKARAEALQKNIGLLPTTLIACQKELSKIAREIRSLEKEAVDLRRLEQHEMQQQRLRDGDKAGAIAIRNIIHAEELTQMWSQLRYMEDREESGFTSIEIPTDEDFTNCKQCTSWKIVDQPSEVEAKLLQRNKVHFGQAHGTFPTIPPFSDAIDWGASTPAADAILQGHSPFPQDAHIPATAQLLLTALKQATALDSITHTFTEKEWVGKMKIWNELTTTSPSGLHLGHHKALVKPIPIQDKDKDDMIIVGLPGQPVSPEIPGPPTAESLRTDLLQSQLDLMNLAITHKYAFERWMTVATVMLRKDLDNTKIHRLRVIHLYEADLNLLLGVKWRKLVHHCIDNSLLNQWQFGGLPGREAITPAFLEELQWEITRTSRRSLARMDFDASSCYDRIIPSISSLVSRSLGQHQSLVCVHARFLHQAKYYLKTKLGISEEYFQHCKISPIYGTGQGSANSPVGWAFISSKLFDIVEQHAHGATFWSPCKEHKIRVCVVGFVDDTNSCVNDFCAPTQDPFHIHQLATDDAQLWNDLLSTTGGALEVPKCKLLLAHYAFTATGAPILTHTAPDVMPIHVTPTPGSQPLRLEYPSPFDARKTLGCWKGPSGNQNKALVAITKNAKQRAELVAASPLTPPYARKYYEAVFWSSVTYSFCVNFIPKAKLDALQQQVTRPFLQKMGYSSRTPRAIVYGPRSNGGIGLKSFYDKQGAGQVCLFLKHWRHNSGVQTHLIIALAWLQKLSGLGKPILSNPSIPLPHLPAGWITSMRGFLCKIGGSMELDRDLSVPLQREGDFHLMEDIIQSHDFTPKEIRYISACQQYLQVHTISDLALADGIQIDRSIVAGNPSILSSKSNHLEVHQPKPDSSVVWTTWRKACRRWYWTHTCELKSPLGKWLHPSRKLRRDWPYHWSPWHETVYLKGHDFYSAHQRHNTGKFYAISSMHWDKLPSDAYPIQITEGCSAYEAAYLRITSKPGIKSIPSSAHPPSTFDDYSQSWDTWESSLLQRLDPKFSHSEIHQALCTAGHPSHQNPGAIGEINQVGGTSPTTTASQHKGATGVSDGSVNVEQGTFGWSLAKRDGTVLIDCIGPVFGMNMDSYRAEGYGHLSILLYIAKLSTFFHRTPQHIQLFCDNQALVDKVNQLRTSPRPEFANDTLAHSWDILQAIRTLLKDQPTTTIKHVKGHQDISSSAQQSTPLEVTLNIRADVLAGEFQSQTNHKYHKVPLIAGTKCQLHVQGSTLVSQFPRWLQIHQSTIHLQDYLAKRYSWSFEDYCSIDWKAHHQATSNLGPKLPTKFIVKFIHNLLPIGKLIHRYDSVKYTCECPSCPNLCEDGRHFLQCPRPHRRTWWTDIKKTLLNQPSTTDPQLMDVLVQLMSDWLDGRTTSLISYSPQIQILIISQQTIGIHHLFLGRWSNLWQKYQLQYVERQQVTKSNQNHGTLWASSLIRVIWQYCYASWKIRNTDKHGAVADTKLTIKNELAKRRIHALYKLKPLCFPTIRNKWFYATVDIHFQENPKYSQLQSWLSIHEPMIRSHTQKRKQLLQDGHRRSIDDYFQPTADR